jgi:hypothetical protein
MNVVGLCLALTAFLMTTSPSLADDVLGTWLRDNGDLKVKFDPCGARFGFESQSRAASVLRHATHWG